ncbi:uncharacterized protein [Diabrotica undecimpunctata]|uniref:uncharacterized protein n=1 Tax=Diabrotica undecimpunctata TaxID=50387 RepID=UPI003B641B0C
MMGAAKQINEVFDEFAKIMYKNYSEDWTDFNKYVFIRYFWCTEFVQQKVKDILRTRASPGDPPGTLEALETIQNLWITKKKQIQKMNADHSLTEGSVGMFTEDLMIDDHRKVLAISFWVKRIDEKKNQNLKRFNHHIFQILIKPDFQQARPLVDTNGECICEECMIAYFDVMLQHPKGNCGMLPSPPRRICCRRCRTLLALDNFHLHVKDHADKVGEISLKDILKNNVGRSPVLFEDSPEDSEI